MKICENNSKKQKTIGYVFALYASKSKFFLSNRRRLWKLSKPAAVPS
jgi:hypothetical protein